MNAPDAAGRFGSGRAVPRIEDRALLQGRGRFTDNVEVAGAAPIAFLRSPYAHARIVGIDVAAARAMPGVLGVFTGADLEAAGVKPLPTTPDFRRADGRPTVTPLRRGLAHEFARYVGEALAAVVAETREQARDALEAIVLDLEELPAVADARAAREPGAPVVTADAPDNIAAEMRHGDAAATEAAFARAAHRVALEVHNQRLAPAPMEPRSVVARFDEASGRLEVRIGNQMPPQYEPNHHTSSDPISPRSTRPVRSNGTTPSVAVGISMRCSGASCSSTSKRQRASYGAQRNVASRSADCGCVANRSARPATQCSCAAAGSEDSRTNR